MPCGDEPPVPSDCACALLIPPFASPYADYATAETAIADQTDNCIGYAEPAATLTSFAATLPAADTVDLDATFTLAGQAQGGCVVSVALKSGNTLSVSYTVSSTGTGDGNNEATVNVQDCNGAGVYTDSDSSGGTGAVSGTFTLGPFASGGEYVITVGGQGQNTDDPDESTTVTLDFSISSDDTMWVNPVIALWDDSGTTRRLWACPKLLLPPLTESTGTWYADCAAADAVLTDALQVSNCVGFCEGGPGLSAFTATDGGTSLTLATTGGAGAALWGGVNLESGETLSVAGTTSTTSAEVQVFIYDDTGALVEDSGGFVATPFTSSALPYTGRYTVKINVIPSGGGAADVSGVITSSGTLSVNPIQARYDLGLTCPGTLDCGDACP